MFFWVWWIEQIQEHLPTTFRSELGSNSSPELLADVLFTDFCETLELLDSLVRIDFLVALLPRDVELFFYECETLPLGLEYWLIIVH